METNQLVNEQEPIFESPDQETVPEEQIPEAIAEEQLPETTETESVPNEAAEFRKTIEELRAYEKKNLRINRFRLLCSAAAMVLLAVVLILLLVNVRSITKQIEDVSKVVIETGTNVNTVAEDLSKVDFETLGKSMQNIADVGEDTLKQVSKAAGGLDTMMENAGKVMDHLNSIDFDDLNNGIKSLNEVLEPLSKFFNIFH